LALLIANSASLHTRSNCDFLQICGRLVDTKIQSIIISPSTKQACSNPNSTYSFEISIGGNAVPANYDIVFGGSAKACGQASTYLINDLTTTLKLLPASATPHTPNTPTPSSTPQQIIHAPTHAPLDQSSSIQIVIIAVIVSVVGFVSIAVGGIVLWRCYFVPRRDKKGPIVIEHEPLLNPTDENFTAHLLELLEDANVTIVDPSELTPVEILGSGATGTVVAAKWSTRNDMLVAVKALNSNTTVTVRLELI